MISHPLDRWLKLNWHGATFSFSYLYLFFFGQTSRNEFRWKVCTSSCAMLFRRPWHNKQAEVYLLFITLVALSKVWLDIFVFVSFSFFPISHTHHAMCQFLFCLHTFFFFRVLFPLRKLRALFFDLWNRCMWWHPPYFVVMAFWRAWDILCGLIKMESSQLVEYGDLSKGGLNDGPR